MALSLGNTSITKGYLGSTEITKAYLGSTLILDAVSFDTDYQAILDEATTQGYTLPSASDQVIQNARLVSAKSSGIWVLSDLIYVWTEDGSIEFKMINWKNPTGPKGNPETGSFVTGDFLSMVNSSTGIKGDGIHYIDIGINPVTGTWNYTANDAGAYVNIITEQIDFGVVLSTTSSGNNTLKIDTNAPTQNSRLNSTNVQHDFTTTGLLGLSKTGTTALTASINTTTTDYVVTDVAISNASLSIWGQQWATSADWTRGDSEIGYVIIGANMVDKLTDIKTAFD